MPVEHQLRLGVDLVVEVGGERVVREPDHEHRRRARRPEARRGRPSCRPGGGPRRGLVTDASACHSEGGCSRASTRLVAGSCDRSAYGGGTTAAVLWTLVQRRTGPRVGASASRGLHPSGIRHSRDEEPGMAPNGTQSGGTRGHRRAETRMGVVDRESAVITPASFGRTLRHPRPRSALRGARFVRAAARVRRVPLVVAGRVRLPRHALGAGAGAARRERDLPGADPGRGRRRKPRRLPAALHPRGRAARAAAGRRGGMALARHPRRRRRRGDVGRRRPGLALPRARRHLARRGPRRLLREPHGVPVPPTRTGVALSRGERRSWESRSGRPSRRS